jgi:polysaccharide biosynthesis protein PslJ
VTATLTDPRTEVVPAPARRSKVDTVALLSVYVFLLMLIPSALAFAPLGSAGSPATILGVLLLAGYIIAWLHPGLAQPYGRQPVRFAVLVFAFVVVAAYVSVNRTQLAGLLQNAADVGMILLAAWVGVSLLAADGIGSIERLHVLFRRIVLCATAMSALAAVQFFTGLNAAAYIVIPGLTQQTFADLQSRDSLNRPAATAAHPLELAAVLAMCLPLALHQARFAPPDKRWVRWLQVCLIGGALPMTLSRTAVTAIAAICLVLLPTWPKRDRRIAYGVGLVAVAGMFATIPGLLGTFSSLFAQVGSDTSSTSRTGAFSSAIPLVTQHPWLGMGFNVFFPQTYFFTDDQYLLSLIDTGILGLLALILLFVVGWHTARAVRRVSTDPEIRDLAQCLAASVAASAVSFATFDATSFYIASGLTFLIIGCVGALWRLTRPPPARAPAVR